MSCVLLSVVLALSPRTSLACSPIDGTDYSASVTLVQKFASSPVVVSGVPIKMYDDETSPTLYGVDLKVYCVFKGQNIQQKIRINDVGYAPGMCGETNLTLGIDYLVYLQPDNPDSPNAFIQLFNAESGAKGYVEETVYMCGAISEYPQGVTKETSEITCPQPNEMPEECMSPPTTEAPPIPKLPDGEVGPPPDVPQDSKTGEDMPQDSKTGKKDDKGASYESVVDDSIKNNNNNNNNNNDGDKDAATAIATNWVLTFSAVLALFHLL